MIVPVQRETAGVRGCQVSVHLYQFVRPPLQGTTSNFENWVKSIKGVQHQRRAPVQQVRHLLRVSNPHNLLSAVRLGGEVRVREEFGSVPEEAKLGRFQAAARD